MRSFFSSMLGALAALTIFFSGLLFCGLLLLILLAAANQKESQAGAPASGSYLVFNLETNISEAPQQLEFGDFPKPGAHLQLRTATRALKAAAQDARIAGLVLTGSLAPSGYGTSFAALRELRQALEVFRKSGKPLHAFVNAPDTRDIYLASVATDFAVDPFGLLLMPGLATRPTFYTGFFEKFGIGVQVTRVGKYKSAVEPFLRRDLSPENREQLTGLLTDLWTSCLEDIAQTRKLTTGTLQNLVDAEGLLRPESALKAGLIDRVIYRDVLLDELKTRTGRKGSKESFLQISLKDYAEQVPPPKRPKGGKPGRVALVYAEGEIIDGDGGRGLIGGERLARELRRLRQDEAIKAVVLRVNSPGGSASASEVIQREVRLLKAKKPVVVSMGGVAASGGYWISAYGTRIFAEPTTVTGSIGVFGLFLDIEKLATNLGFSFDTVKTGTYGDLFTLTRPKTEQELARFQSLVDFIYEGFVARVAEARQLPLEEVKEIAQGRVWSGLAAKRLKLVDELGGLEDALREAGRLAGLGEEPQVEEYPRKRDFAEMLAELIDQVQPLSSRQAESSLESQLLTRLQRELAFLRTFDDPRGLYARFPYELQAE